MASFPMPQADEVALTYFIVSNDVAASRHFYAEVLGGEVVRESEPAIVALANGWIIINDGGGPTPDKPEVTLATTDDPNRVSAFLNIRVGDIAARYAEWRAKGAAFITEPIDRGVEIRAYMRDPDENLIEVGQFKA